MSNLISIFAFANLTTFISGTLTLLHSERPKLYTILVFLSAIGLCAQYIETRMVVHG